ncbi:MAG: hypothetical protein [Wendovervirus sonii]|uniref:Uncharacterized protein n=1 Tax=phage Lak_Megaphage_Sonny TaxID=3109229 RepID=A0ABZ0Z411_9CAUD|nr:MAG: hypothetical protein [phage Lak_Megaphage_Sonny]
MNKKQLYESIMHSVSIEVRKALNESEKEMTPSEKIDAWMNGERKENIKACSPDKLREYYKICKRKGFDEGMEEIENVAKSRNIKLNESTHFNFE